MYQHAATRAFQGEFGSREARVTASREAELFWDGYDGKKTELRSTNPDYVYYALGRDVRTADRKDEEKKQYTVNGKVISEYQLKIYEEVPDIWVSAERISQKTGGDSKAVGAALMTIARRGLLERKPTTPPYYRRKKLQN